MEMSRKIRTFKGEREADEFRDVAILGAVVLIIIVFFLFSFSLGLIQPFFDSLLGISTTTNSSLNSPSTAISIQALVTDYAHSPSSAGARYSGRTLYVSGNITGIQNPGIYEYENCITLSLTNPYDCTNLPGTSYWVIWQYQNPNAALSVTTGSNFIAYCTVNGMTGNDLYLSSCQSVSS